LDNKLEEPAPEPQVEPEPGLQVELSSPECCDWPTGSFDWPAECCDWQAESCDWSAECCDWLWAVRSPCTPLRSGLSPYQGVGSNARVFMVQGSGFVV